MNRTRFFRLLSLALALTLLTALPVCAAAEATDPAGVQPAQTSPTPRILYIMPFLFIAALALKFWPTDWPKNK